MWDKSRDARLFKLKAEGYSFAEIGEMLGTSRNAAIGRYSRLSGKIFPSQVLRDKQAKESAKARQAEIQRLRADALARIKKDISRGLPKLVIIKSALKNGATFQTIADAFECSKQNIHQMVA